MFKLDAIMLQRFAYFKQDGILRRRKKRMAGFEFPGSRGGLRRIEAEQSDQTTVSMLEPNSNIRMC
jgi:hypothetical protein